MSHRERVLSLSLVVLIVLAITLIANLRGTPVIVRPTPTPMPTPVVTDESGTVLKPGEPCPTGVHLNPSFSPNGELIAYVQRNWAMVCVMNADGTDQHAVTGPLGDSVSIKIQWGPTSGQLAITNIGPSDSYSWTTEPDGRRQEPTYLGNVIVGGYIGDSTILLNNENFSNISINASKGLFAYLKEEDGHFFLAVATNAGEHKITLGSANTSGIWLPNGEEILYKVYAGDPETYDLNIVGRDGSNLRTIAMVDQDTQFDISPDGKLIYLTLTKDHLSQIYVMNVDGSNLRKVSDGNGHDYDLDLSPDGTQLVFASYRNGTTEIYLMDADGGRVRQLTGEKMKQ